MRSWVPAVLWSFAKAGRRHNALLQAASDHGTRIMGIFQPQSVVRLGPHRTTISA